MNTKELEATPLETEEVLQSIEEVEIPGITPDPDDVDEFAKQKDWLKKQVWTKRFRKYWGLKLPQFKHTEQKQGRNEPCKCNSGKKYKKCCMIKKEHDGESRELAA